MLDLCQVEPANKIVQSELKVPDDEHKYDDDGADDEWEDNGDDEDDDQWKVSPESRSWDDKAGVVLKLSVRMLRLMLRWRWGMTIFNCE